jgi:hypothetical protein
VRMLSPRNLDRASSRVPRRVRDFARPSDFTRRQRNINESPSFKGAASNSTN